MLISQKLEQMAQQFDDARRTIARFALEDGDRAVRMPLADIAAETFTSKATLVRFAKQLGFRGWIDFAQSYRDELVRSREHQTDIDANTPFGAGARPADIADTVCRLRADAARQTADELDPRNLAHACDLLIGARRIMLYGVSANAWLLSLFRHKLMQIGIIAEQPEQSEFGLAASTLTAEDCAVMVSYTGESNTRAPMAHIVQLERVGCPVVALTGEGDNYLREHATVALTILSRENLYAKVGMFSTEESTMCLLDALYSCLFARNYERNLAWKSCNSRVVEQNRLPGGSGWAPLSC